MKQGSLRTNATEHAACASGTATEHATSGNATEHAALAPDIKDSRDPGKDVRFETYVPRSLLQSSTKCREVAAGGENSGPLTQKIQTRSYQSGT